MRARIRDTEIFFDVEGAALVPDGTRMVERLVAFLRGTSGPDSAAAAGPVTERRAHVGRGRGEPAHRRAGRRLRSRWSTRSWAG